MKSMGIVALKEIRDNLRDRRTLLSALVFGPLFGPVLFAMMMKFVIDREMEEVNQPVPVTVVGAEHAPALVDQLGMHGADVTLSDETPEALLAADNELAVLRIPPDFAETLASGHRASVEVWHDAAKRKSDQRADRVADILEGWGNKIAALRLVARGVAPELVRPVIIDRQDVSTAASRSSLIFAMLPYFVLLAGILGCFYLAIDATAGERERGSLEPLLCLPVGRGKLVMGKILAAVAFSLASLALSIVMFSLAMPRIGLEAIGMNGNLSVAQVLMMFLATAPFALFAAGMLTLVASFAKSYKEAQTYLSVVMLIPLIPVIISSIKSVDLTLGGALVPGLSQHLIILEIIKGVEVAPVMILASAGGTLALGLLMSLAATWIYRSERILG